jgi:CHAT domain-containing protein/Tfp pilus assembly protein PilF
MPHQRFCLSCAVILSLFILSPAAARRQGHSQSIESFAAALLEAKSATERAALLETEKPFLTLELRQIVLAQGDKLYNQKDWQKALHAYQVGQAVASHISDKPGLGSSLFKIGTVYFAQNRFAPALEAFQQSLVIRTELADKPAMVDSLRNIGALQRLLGNTERSLETLHKAESLLPEVKENNARAAVFNGLGLTYRTMGNLVTALSYAQQALQLYEQENDKRAVAGMQTNIGNIYQAQGGYDFALDYARKSLATSEAIKDQSLIAMAQNNIGNIYFARGDYRLAMDYYQKSLRLKEEANDLPGITNTLSNIGRIYYRQGDYDRALSYFTRSIESKKSLNDKTGIAALLINLGLIHRDRNELAKALNYFQESLQLAKETKNLEVVSESLNNLGTVYYQQGNHTKAFESFQEGLALRQSNQNQRGISNSLGNLGFYYLSQNRPEEALQAAQRSYDIDKESGSLEDLWCTLSIKGSAYKMLGKPLEAQQAFAEAIRAIEALRAQAAGDALSQQNFMVKKISPYYHLIELLVNEGKGDQALYYAERSKAGLLLSILQSAKVTITKAMSDAEKAQERLLKDEISSLNSQIGRESLRLQINESRVKDLQERLKKAVLGQQQFQESLYARHPDLKVQRGQVSGFTVEQAARLLPDNQTALLEYAITNRQVFLFVLTKDAKHPNVRLKTYELDITPEQLTSAAQDFRALLASHNLLFRPAASQLYQWLIKPAQAELQGKNRLIIVPDGALWELPFQALQGNEGHYLIERFAVSYAPSLSVLTEMAKHRDRRAVDKKAANLLAFANPLMSREVKENDTDWQGNPSAKRTNSFSQLPESEAEVKPLAQLYGHSRSKIYTGAEASEERLKAEAPTYRILHLATHSVLNNASPMYSQVVLSQARSTGKEDGFLEAWEIAQLNLDSDLVVLSACETARGRLSAGEGMIGLTWAFFVAGSSATLVSQWKVDEASTAELMLEFHRHLQSAAENSSKPLTKAEALRNATLKMLQSNQYRHPFYWAAFVLIGNGQ